MTTNYTNKELYDMIIVFGKCDEQSRKAARLYARKYPDRIKPHHLFFARLAARLESNAQLRPIKRAGKYLLIIFFGNTILIIIFLLSLIAFLYRTGTAK